MQHMTNTDNPIDFPKSVMERAIEFVMQFYSVSREDAVNYYSDEIEAYLSLSSKGVV